MRVLRLLQRAELALEQRLDARALASDGQAHLLASEPHAAVHHLEEGLALGLGLSVRVRVGDRTRVRIGVRVSVRVRIRVSVRARTGPRVEAPGVCSLRGRR